VKLRPLLGISVGDPAGVGPEVTAKALGVPGIYELCRPLVVCDLRVMKDAIRFSHLNLKPRAVISPEDGQYKFRVVDVLDMKNVDMANFEYKKVAAMTGRASFEYVKKVITLALNGQVNATVTGPIHKEAINLAGFPYAGHTEIYADLTNTKDCTMMLAHENFRVVHVSTHVSLQEACRRVKKPRVLRVIQMADSALKRLGIADPKVAVAGLNPHCGEGGLFGREDMDEIAPAVAEAREQGINATGPLPGDTVFSLMRGGRYDVVVAMYHDQGHIPTKLLGFQYDVKTDAWSALAGINITLGLPIIRTSVDHGVAFDRAGEGRANPQSMFEAIRMAARLSSSSPSNQVGHEEDGLNC